MSAPLLLHSVSYSGSWGQQFLSVEEFVDKAADLGYNGVMLAAKGQLTANLEAQARRMLKDPRARELVDSFAIQWLQLKRISFVAPDGGLFPQFRYGLRESMLKETALFVEAVLREDRSVLDFLGADFTFLEDRKSVV